MTDSGSNSGGKDDRPSSFPFSPAGQPFQQLKVAPLAPPAEPPPPHRGTWAPPPAPDLPGNMTPRARSEPQTRILIEEEGTPPPSGHVKLFVIGGAAVLLLLVGIIGFSFMREFGSASKDDGKLGLTSLAMYGQTRSRLELLAEVGRRHFDRHGAAPESAADFIKEGADPSLMRDKWRTPFRIGRGVLTSAGMDRKFDTEDDMWIDIFTLAVGGFHPDAGEMAERKDLAPAARGIFHQVDRVNKIVKDKEEQSTEMINDESDLPALSRDSQDPDAAWATEGETKKAEGEGTE